MYAYWTELIHHTGYYNVSFGIAFMCIYITITLHTHCSSVNICVHIGFGVVYHKIHRSIYWCPFPYSQMENFRDWWNTTNKNKCNAFSNMHPISIVYQISLEPHLLWLWLYEMNHKGFPNMTLFYKAGLIKFFSKSNIFCCVWNYKFIRLKFVQKWNLVYLRRY